VEEARRVAIVEERELAVELAPFLAEELRQHRILEVIEREIVEAALAELGVDLEHAVAERGRRLAAGGAELGPRLVDVHRRDGEEEIERLVDGDELAVRRVHGAHQPAPSHHLEVLGSARRLDAGELEEAALERVHQIAREDAKHVRIHRRSAAIDRRHLEADHEHAGARGAHGAKWRSAGR
jgi:hypothetical protein